MDGSVNITAPNPVSNQVFTKTLAKQLHRPAFMPMPAAVARLVFKDLADELLLADAKVMPQRLQQVGFKFQNPIIDQGIETAL